ncbi:arsenate reductase family protein [Paracoccus laeviglucosivorans]|uniref:Arsenate reductase n=1 Tax=Paracoccus laeviglucosivorans TaxID=1197861 RepID=A0A521DXA0_9RHOB|nr:arsenate reductase family protein [Paracoccus laeviglucosivorans]SMO76343.1 arsenate reductase [Paracoccus laeviglucosivorans]
MITIYHKPNCSTSRNVLKMIRDAGHDPVVIEYLKDGWTRGQLWGLISAAGLTPRQALRVKEPAAKALSGAGDEAIIAAMIADPVLVERPFVCGPGGVRLCRPVDLVMETLDR